MLIRNGIKQNLRAKRRTIPFFILITILTIVMIFSIGINTFCNNSITNANTSYRSIIELEYMGTDYPSKYSTDSYSREAYSKIDFSKIKEIDGVNSISYPIKESAYLPGYSRKSNDLLYADYAVLVVNHIGPIYHKSIEYCEKGTPGARYDKFNDYYYIEIETFAGYTGTISKNIYSYDGRENVFINIEPTSEMNFDYKKSYLIHGFLTSNGVLRNGFGSLVVEDFPEGDSGLVELTSNNQYLIEDSIFTKYAKKYLDCNNFCFINEATNIEDLFEFHEGELSLVEGRFPYLDEYDACVVTSDIFKQLGINLGDTITLEMLDQNIDNIFELTKTDKKETLRVVGYTNESYNYTGEIYRISNEKPEIIYGYTLATISVDNNKANQVIEEIKQYLPNNVRATLLDQGYSSFVSAFNSVSLITSVISYITSIGVIMVIIIFSFFFIVKQKEQIKTLILFGATKKDVRTWIMSGALSISITGTLLGGIIGISLLPLVLKLISMITTSLNKNTLLYSETTLGLTKEISEKISIPVFESLITIAVIMLLIVISLSLFLRATYKDALPKKGVISQKFGKADVNTKAKGPLKFAILSIIRRKNKSLIVPIVSFVLTVMIILLSSVYQGYSNTIDEESKDIKVEGQITSVTGTQYSDISLKLPNYLEFSSLPFIDEIYISQRANYYLEGTIPHFSSSGFGQEHKEDWILAQPEVVFINNLLGAKEFYYVEPNVTFLEGYDETVFLKDYPTYKETSLEFTKSCIYPIVVNECFIGENKAKLGDNITIYLTTSEYMAECKIVGYYSGLGSTNNIYAPISMSTPLSFLDSDYQVPDGIYKYNKVFSNKNDLYFTEYKDFALSTLRFTIKDGYKLDNVRSQLSDLQYTSPNRIRGNRTTVLFRDSKIVELQNTLGRYVTLGKIILLFILLIVSLIAFVISWLNIHGRNREFLIMRGLGVPKKDVFMAFILEQGLLLLIGFILGLVALFLINSFGILLLLSLVGFLVFYLLGAGIEIKMLNNINLMELLGRGEE